MFVSVAERWLIRLKFNSPLAECWLIRLGVMAFPPNAPQFWEFDYTRYRYFGRVRIQSLPLYSAPYPLGYQVDITYNSHQPEWEFFEHSMAAHNNYISVRTAQGWVNIWCLLNRWGRPSGVRFADVRRVDDIGSSSGPVVGSSGGAGSSGAGSSGDGSSGNYNKMTPAGSRRRHRGPYE